MIKADARWNAKNQMEYENPDAKLLNNIEDKAIW